MECLSRTRVTGGEGRLLPAGRSYGACAGGMRALRPRAVRPLRGFTLIELMVVVALIAITLSFAVPSFQGFLDRARTDAAAAELAGLLSLARSEAIRRNAPVTICRATAANSTTCAQDSQSDWSGRWILFQDTDNDQVRAPAEELIRVHEPVNASLAVSLAAPVRSIQLTSRGYLFADGALAFQVSASSSDRRNLNVCVSRAGRIDQRTAACA